MPVSIAYTLAPGAHAPTRATPGAAGMDLYARLPSGPLMLDRGERACIGTGVSLAIPPGYEGQVRPRSGLALQHGLTVLNSPGTIDADYRGEVAVILVNLGGAPVTIKHGDRIAQLVVCPVADAVLTAADSLPPTERGEGGFGSTGTGTGTGTGPHLSDAWKHDSGATATAPATVPVTLPRRSPDAARAYHEGYAAALRSVGGWLREKADASEAIAATHGVVGGWLGDCATDSDDDRAALEARVRALDAEVAEARAEAAQWAAELDALRGERAAVVAWLRECAHAHDGLGSRNTGHLVRTLSGAIERGEHRAGGEE